MSAPVQEAILQALAVKPLSLRALIAECDTGTEASIRSALARLIGLRRVVMTDGRAPGGGAIYAIAGQRCPTCGCLQPRIMEVEE